MLLNFLKEFWVKRKLKNSIEDLIVSQNSNKILTIGLLIDENDFLQKENLLNEIVANGILEENIELLICNKNKKEYNSNYNYFSPDNLDWESNINNKLVSEFVNKEFDVLISYYDFEKAVLLLITHNSKALFKVGFSTIDKRVNNLLIHSKVSDYKIFTSELFRYLKILNKI